MSRKLYAFMFVLLFLASGAGMATVVAGILMLAESGRTLGSGAAERDDVPPPTTLRRLVYFLSLLSLLLASASAASALISFYSFYGVVLVLPMFVGVWMAAFAAFLIWDDFVRSWFSRRIAGW